MEIVASPGLQHRVIFQTVSAVQSIFRILERLRETRSLLTITLPGHDSPYTSAILDVQLAQHRLVLDELMPNEGQILLSVARRLNVYGRLQGLETRFTSSVDQIEERAGIAHNGVLFPEFIEHEQKRSAYRVHIGLGYLVPVILDGCPGGPYTGQLRNLSVTGLGAVFPPTTKIPAALMVPSCRIKLVSGTLFTCALDIRFARPDRTNRELHVGGHFMNLTPAQERAIQHAVCTFEREMLRK